MARLDLAGYLDDDSVEIPGISSDSYPEGKTYRFKSPNAKTGMMLASLADIGLQANQNRANIGKLAEKIDLNDSEEHDLMKLVMGETLDEMVADGVSWMRIQKINNYLFIHFSLGAEAAEMYVKRMGEAQAPVKPSPTRRGASTKKTPAMSKTPAASPVGSKKTPPKKR